MNLQYASASEFAALCAAAPFTRQVLCPRCGSFLRTSVVEDAPPSQQRRCVAECSGGHRFITPYD